MWRNFWRTEYWDVLDVLFCLGYTSMHNSLYFRFTHFKTAWLRQTSCPQSVSLEFFYFSKILNEIQNLRYILKWIKIFNHLIRSLVFCGTPLICSFIDMFLNMYWYLRLSFSEVHLWHMIKKYKLIKNV